MMVRTALMLWVWASICLSAASVQALPVADAGPDITVTDADGDGVDDVCDNCLGTANETQSDCDDNGTGDACEGGFTDSDQDGVDDVCDNCDATSNADQADEVHPDTVGDACDDAADGDGVFDLDDREEMITEAVAHLPNVSVRMFSGLVVDIAAEAGADFIVKGLRAVSDFENELQMAQMNNAASGMHTVFIPSASRSSFLASKFIRDFARFGGDISKMVPPHVAQRLKEKYG